MEKKFFLRKYFEAKAVVGYQLTHQKKRLTDLLRDDLYILVFYRLKCN